MIFLLLIFKFTPQLPRIKEFSNKLNLNMEWLKNGTGAVYKDGSTIVKPEALEMSLFVNEPGLNYEERGAIAPDPRHSEYGCKDDEVTLIGDYRQLSEAGKARLRKETLKIRLEELE